MNPTIDAQAIETNDQNGIFTSNDVLDDNHSDQQPTILVVEPELDYDEYLEKLQLNKVEDDCNRASRKVNVSDFDNVYRFSAYIKFIFGLNISRNEVQQFSNALQVLRILSIFININRISSLPPPPLPAAKRIAAMLPPPILP